MGVVAMIVANCQRENSVKRGKDRKGNQRMKCTDCGKFFVAEGARPLGDMRISMKQATMALGMLLEGMSIRAVERITGIHRDTIDNLILTVGESCQNLLREKVKGVEVKDVEADEIWSFVGCKEKNRVAA